MTAHSSLFALTMDTDWVPQFVLDDVLDLLREHHVPATVFCTGAYSGLDGDLFEAGMHPNFLPGSSHGSTEEECFAHVRSILPRALGMRSHCYWWHNRMFSRLTEAGLRYDSSLLTPLQPMLRPYRMWGLTRFPVWYGDNLHFSSGRSFERFDLPELSDPGMKVLLFHPIHIYLNSGTAAETQEALAGKTLPLCRPEDLLPHRRGGAGMRTLFLSALRLLRGERCVRLEDAL